MEFFNEILVIITLIIFQSIFGVGLLLFGTPTFLYFNYSFSETLSLLLPISFTISLIQYLNSKEKDIYFNNKFNLFTLPSLVVCQIIILNYQNIINLKIFISIMLILLSITSLDAKKFSFLRLKNIYKNIFLIFLGIIHGLTNLGGGFLALYSNIIVKKNKNLTRYYISYGYLVMVSVQLIILFTLHNKDFDYYNLFYVILVFIFYLPTQLIYKKIKVGNFSMIIKIIAILYGFIVLGNSINLN